MTSVIDVHAHILSEEMMRRMRREAPELGPELSEVDAEGAVLRVGAMIQRPFPRGGWDLETRIADLDAAGFTKQALSVCPQTFLYDLDPALTTTLSQLQNEAIAELVRDHPDRFLGLATVPLQDPQAAARELRRALTELKLHGVQIGSHVEGRNLDDPALEPFWAEANALKAFIMIHPQKTMGGDRLGRYYLKNLIGNPLDTTVAIASLVFGGVIERHPDIAFCMVHGGGFTPYQFGRMVHGWQVRPECRLHIKESPEASVRKLHFDTLTHSQPALRYLVDTFGADRVLVGTDYPFDMGTLDGPRHVGELGLPKAEHELILGRRAEALLHV